MKVIPQGRNWPFVLCAVLLASAATAAHVAESDPFTLDVLSRTDDSDGDGMADSWESTHGLSTGVDDSLGDPDGDGRTNIDEYNAGLHPQVSEPPRLPSAVSGQFTLQLRDTPADADGDGMPDEWESVYGLVVGVDDSALDPDGDGVSNRDEYNGGWDPAQPEFPESGRSESAVTTVDTGAYPGGWRLDTDDDGMPDWWEIEYGLLIVTDDSSADPDGDGIPNGTEYAMGLRPDVDDLWGVAVGLSPLFAADMRGLPPDSDGDGLPDWWEQAHGLDWMTYDPWLDTDTDGRGNLNEYNAGTDPNVDDWRGPDVLASPEFVLDTGGFNGGYSADSDGDGMPDWWEVKYGLDLGQDDSQSNPDGDALANVDEYNSGANPTLFDYLVLVDAEGNVFALDSGGRLVDTDGDGMPDWWERAYSGGPTNLQAHADLDVDGQSNLEEYTAKRVPVDALSVFAIADLTSPAPGTNTGWVITWDSAAYRVYTPYTNAGLKSGWAPVAIAEVHGITGTQSYTNTTDAPHALIRLGVRLAAP